MKIYQNGLNDSTMIDFQYFYVVDIWYNLGNVSDPEGPGIGNCYNTTLDKCKDKCSLNSNCNSFAFSERSTIACCLKENCVSQNQKTKPVEGYVTYFKDCGKIINIL